MTKSIQQIKQNLSNLETTATKIAVELGQSYQSYLDLLSQSLKQQLILASYQICTQFYPQEFLNLSLNNKQHLQQVIRHIGIELKPTLYQILEQKELDPEPRELNLMAELIKNLPKPKRKKEAQDEENLTETEIDFETIKAELGNNIELIAIDASSEDESELEELNSQTPIKQTINVQNPEHLILWHKQIERKIKKTLDSTSKKINKCLQDSGLIPDRIPSKIIDVAIQTDAGNKGGRNNRKLPNAPHILHLAIETEQNQKSKSSQDIAQISLLRLRLAEIEFTDPILNAQRGQIQNLLNQINKLNSQYQITKHEITVAEAQAAWRSSWYED
jgi:hypothetical protein